MSALMRKIRQLRTSLKQILFSKKHPRNSETPSVDILSLKISSLDTSTMNTAKSQPLLPSPKPQPTAAIIRISKLRKYLGIKTSKHAHLPPAQSPVPSDTASEASSSIPDADLFAQSLFPIRRPPHSATCVLCNGCFDKRAGGIRVLSCGHYLHVGCAKEECTRKGSLAGSKEGGWECSVCDCFWATMGRLEEEKRVEGWKKFALLLRFIQ